MGRSALQDGSAVPQSPPPAIGTSQDCAWGFNTEKQVRVSNGFSRDEGIQQVYGDIGAFLAEHRLYPAPANYALVFNIVTEPEGPAATAVAAVIADGLRLSQADADRIRVECGIDVSGGAPVPTQETLARARRQIDDFAQIVETTRAQAEAYGEDLIRGAEELGQAEIGHPAVAEVVRITGAMIERTRKTETQLEVARMEASSLRRRLAEAEDEARRDPLTRLPNRRAFEDKLEELLASSSLCSIAICDIDHFKSINDGHGHAVGDRVLKMFADVLSNNCDQHMVARIGGEEFVVLFEGLTPDVAGEILDDARSELGARTFRIRGTDVPLGRVTFSAGVAHCVERSGEAPLKRADDLLYRAKNAGRNQVLIEAA